MIKIVAATTKSEKKFLSAAPLGISLGRLAGDTRVEGRIHCRNTGTAREGLPAIFNRQIDASVNRLIDGASGGLPEVAQASQPALSSVDGCDDSAADADSILLFTHDDVWLDDFFLAERLVDALERFDIVGVAGNRRILPDQSSWCFVGPEFTWDDPGHLSGTVGHDEKPFGAISYYGPAPASCELLDGVFLAVRASVLVRSKLRFDEHFRFHFYDMDFCREARRLGLRLGTWPIALTHASAGTYGSRAWNAERRIYFDKWKS